MSPLLVPIVFIVYLHILFLEKAKHPKSGIPETNVCIYLHAKFQAFLIRSHKCLVSAHLPMIEECGCAMRTHSTATAGSL